MKCNQCGKSYVKQDESCWWIASCDLLGSTALIKDCQGCAINPEWDGCDKIEAPAWDCDLGQDNKYCIHHGE